MSDLKQIALEHAVKVSGDGDTALATAKKFHAFLTGGANATPTAQTGAAAKTASPPGKQPATAGKPATGKPAPAAGATPEAKAAARLAARNAAAAAAQDAEDDPEADADADTAGPTKEEVGAKIKELMTAGLRPQAKELLIEFGAEALSGLAPDDYAAFIDKANELLIAA